MSDRYFHIALQQGSANTRVRATHLTSGSGLHKQRFPHPTRSDTEKLRSPFISYSYQVSHSNITTDMFREPINLAKKNERHS